MVTLANIISLLDEGVIPSFKDTTAINLASTYKELASLDHKNSDLFLLGVEKYYEEVKLNDEIQNFEDFFELALVFDRDKNSINRFFDACLGLRTIGNLAKFDQIVQEKQSGIEEDQRVRGSFEYAHTQTHYSLLIDIFNYLRPAPKTRIIDIGSGFGRVGFFLNLCFPELSYLGLEVVQERVECAQKIGSKNSFKNCKFQVQNLAEENYVLPKADYYYFYDPLNEKDLKKVVLDLENQHKHNAAKFSIIALSGYDDFLLEHLKDQSWLQVVRTLEDNFFKQAGLILQTVTT